MNNIEKLISNDVALDKILKANSGDEIKTILKENGMTISNEQLANLQKSFSKQIENISGGSAINWGRMKDAAQVGTGRGGEHGMYWGAGLGAVAGVVDATIKARKGGVKDSWHFMKEALKTSIKAGFLGGAAGLGLGSATQALHELGDQGKKGLNENQ